MLCSTEVAVGDGFAVSEVSCREQRPSWSEVESQGSFRLVLVRVGRFRRRVRDELADLDRTLGYLGVPGEEEYFAHPAGGDLCTSLTVCAELWRSLAGDREGSRRSAVYVDGRLDLAHRRLLRAARGGDVGFALAERLTALFASALRQVVTGPLPGSGRASAADHALVAAARGAVLADHPEAAGLFPLAALLGVSPYRLSRAFPHTLGISLTKYRNRVRVGRALDRVERGEPSLAALAADLGFADQAHLTRTVREHLGYAPTGLRRLLTTQ